MGFSFRSSAGFGKRMEYNLVGKMLMEGLDCYLPLVDDHGVDCVIKKSRWHIHRNPNQSTFKRGRRR